MVVGKKIRATLSLGLAVCLILLSVPAAAQIPPPGPSSGSAGLQGTVPTPPPSIAATITVPTDGSTFTAMPIRVSGLCTSNLLVKIFSNNVFVGSAECINGSYSLQVDIFQGANDLVARIFDALDQPGPDSNIVHVTFNNTQTIAPTGSQLILTSAYARRGANPGSTLTWPLTISGGTPPYAVSADWGDGKPAKLYSEQFPGAFSVDHVYDNAGVYVVIIKATDKDGQTAFLQLVGQSNGAVSQSQLAAFGGNSSVIIHTIIIWIPAALSIPLIAVAFWLGRRHQLRELRKHLEDAQEQ
ncbi:MAG TPA: hypothetical protein VLF91_04850 [Candidatus Saccharimonadales bacterium]|nr:hypothetical protein [Candidatus Saccharimonadales bacterium]